MKTATVRHPSFPRAAVALVGAVLLFVSLAAVLFGIQATSVGEEGLRNHGILGAGFACLAAAMLAFAVILASDAWADRPRDAEAVRSCTVAFLAETGKLGASILVYGGGALLALGVLSSFDGVDSVPGAAFRLAVMAAAIAAIVAWRRRNKSHPRTYDAIGPIWLIAFLFGMAALGAFAGATVLSEYVSDRASGPQTTLCRLSDVDENRPSGRYRFLSPTTLDMEFTSLDDGRTHRVSVSVRDKEALSAIVDSGGVCYLAYYPATRIFVSAEPAQR